MIERKQLTLDRLVFAYAFLLSQGRNFYFWWGEFPWGPPRFLFPISAGGIIYNIKHGPPRHGPGIISPLVYTMVEGLGVG